MKMEYKLQAMFGSHLRIHQPVSIEILGIQDQIDIKSAEIAKLKEDRYIKILKLQNADYEQQHLIDQSKPEQQRLYEEEIKQLK